MPSNGSLSDHFLCKEDLPERIFQVDRYPGHAVRINSYSKPRYLIDILTALEGTPELQKLLSSPLGSLFSLPVRQSSVSGQLVHQMLCRQLDTTNVDETWFVYGGQPLRFSLAEFHQVTGLCCSPLPPVDELAAATTHASGDAPYWYKLIGPKLGSATVKEIVGWLNAEPDMPIWRRFRLALIVIVEGILLCKTQPVRPSVEVVEMVKNVDFFLKYPWGRHSFQRLLRMVKVRAKIETKADLINKLKQSTMAVHGFPLAIQLFAFRFIPLLLQYLPHAEDQSTFLHQTLTHLPKCKSFHTSNILSVENDPSLLVLYPHPDGPPFCSSESEDEKVGNLERLIFAGFSFTKTFWCSGDGSLPSLYTSRKRKQRTTTSGTSDSESSEMPPQRKCSKPKFIKTAEDVNTLLEKKLKGFKASLLADFRGMMRANASTPVVQSPKGKSSSHVSEARSSEPSRVTRSGRAGQYVRVPSGPAASLTLRDGTISATVEPEGSTPATCTAKKPEHPSCSHATVGTAETHLGSEPRSPCSTARQCPPEPPSTSPVKLRFRFSQKRTPAKAFSLLDEENHVSTARHCSTVVPEMPPSVPPVTSHLNKLSETSESSTTAGDSLLEVPPVAPANMPQPVLVDPPTEALHGFPPMDVPSAVMPTTTVDRVVPVLPSPSTLPTSRPQPRRSKRLHSSAAPQVSTPTPAPKLRLRDTSEDVKLKTSSSSVISTLAKPSPTKVTALMSQLRRYTKSEYSISGSVFPATLFFDILKPQKWVSSMHMDLLIAFVWDTHSPFLISHRITILDSMFTSIISNKYMSVKKGDKKTAFVWHPLLISYVKGQVSPRRTELQWMRDADTVYLPMNWGTRYWVGLAIDLTKGHINILDPFEDLTSSRKVVSFMSPFAQMLPQLIRSVCGSIPLSWPDDAFTFTRVPRLAQNTRGGDCGPLSVKFMEITMHGLQASLANLTTAQINNVRLRYALDIYETYVKKL